MKLDLHVHTNFSFDSILKVESIPKVLSKRGIDGLAVTDHDSVKAWAKVRNVCKGFFVIQGMEIMTDKGEILGLFLSEDLKCKKAGVNSHGLRIFKHGDVFDEIKSQGALAVIPHPTDNLRQPFSAIEENAKKITALETLNGRVMSSKRNREAEQLAQKFRLGMTGGSDAHSFWELGRAFTQADASNPEEFRKCLMKHKTVPGGSAGNTIYKISSKVLIKLKRWFYVNRYF